MNKRQKIVQQQFLNNEEEVIKELKKTYTTALDDINNNIKKLNLEIDSIQGAIDMWEDYGGDEEKKILQSQLQSKIYQKQYQEALHGQIDDVLDKMNTEQFNTVSGYLKTCYDDGYIGTLYDLQGQGVPLIMPIDQESVVRAVQLDSKISQGLYNRMGEDVTDLKKVIASEVSRGIATGMTYDQVARNISHKMVGTGYKEGGAMASAMRIARTEGHRIQCQAGMDACYKAKEMGADVVKQWDSTLDGRTRHSHRQVDGEIREIEKPFSNGLMFPGDPSGRASEVVNCRCALLQRARWALNKHIDPDTGEVTWTDGDSFTKMDGTTGKLVTIDADGYDDFKKQYYEAIKNQDLRNFDITEKGKYQVLPFDNVEDYKKYIEPEYQAQRITHADNSVLWAKDGGYIQNADGYKDINGYMRQLKDRLDNPKCQKTMDVLIKRTSSPALKHDYVGYRKVQPSYLQDVLGLNVNGKIKSAGLPWECFKDEKSAQQLSNAINKLVGTEKAFVTDKAVTSVSLCEKINFFKHRTVKFEIQMPSGTKGLITDNYMESEFIAKPKTTLEILGSKVYNESGKSCIKIFAKMIQD